MFYLIDVLWTGFENYKSGDEDWLAETAFYAITNGILMLVPGGFWVSLVINISVSALEYFYEDEIEEIKNLFVEKWNYLWGFEWI